MLPSSAWWSQLGPENSTFFRDSLWQIEALVLKRLIICGLKRHFSKRMLFLRYRQSKLEDQSGLIIDWFECLGHATTKKRSSANLLHLDELVTKSITLTFRPESNPSNLRLTNFRQYLCSSTWPARSTFGVLTSSLYPRRSCSTGRWSSRSGRRPSR